MRKLEVIIIGAGAAGLAAAAALSRARCSALVLEARGRIGGRVMTLRDARSGVPVELGAEFVHGRPEATWSVIREAGLGTYDLPFDHHWVRGERIVESPNYAQALAEVMGGLARVRGGDVSFAEYLRRRRGGAQRKAAEQLAVDFVEGFDAADPERISAKSLAAEQDGVGNVDEEKQFRLVRGYGALMNHLAHACNPKCIKVRLNAIVSEIAWSRGSIEVRCRRGREGREEVHRANRVLVTLPLGVLQMPPESPGSVRFAPDIPAKHAAAAKLASGPVVKAVLTFREAFWEQANPRWSDSVKDLVFLHQRRAAFPTVWSARPLRAPALTVWAGGPKARALSGGTRQELTSAAVESVREMFGLRRAHMAGLVEKAHVYDWPADPFARGAYSYVTVGGIRARAELARPIDKTLYFAGEATDTKGQASTVAGALASGEQAAREMLADL